MSAEFLVRAASLSLLFEFAEMPRVGGARTAEALVAVAVAVATIACVDTAEVAVAGTGRCVHGHSPVWDTAMQRLHWVDMSGFSSGLNLLKALMGVWRLSCSARNS
jgi:hypothetical protein